MRKSAPRSCQRPREDMQAFIQQFEVKAEAEAPETVDCQVTLPIVLGSAGILSLVLTVVTIFRRRRF